MLKKKIIIKIDPRKVHGYRYRPLAAPHPVILKTRDLFYHVIINLGYLSRVFEGGDEFAGRDHTKVMMLPAHESLRAYDPSRAGINDGLVICYELTVFEGILQIRDQKPLP